jgi:enoyl-[acyl-carrier protein] reductase II
MKTRITEILGIKLPLILGPMRQITLGEMAAAVSNAGGFGQVAASGLTGGQLRQEIQTAQDLTEYPFGVNIPVHRQNAFEALEIAIESGTRTITTSGGNPAKITERAKEAGIRVLHKVSTTAMGLKARDAGVDGVIAMGFEAGGHGGRDQVTTFCLVPQLVDALGIPVIASGGIGDARGVVAAFALGAEGVEMGTRFAATSECSVPLYFKDSILAARDNGTVLLGKDFMPLRVLRNQATESIADPDKAREEQASSFHYMNPDGSADDSIMPAGQVAGLIKKVQSVSEILTGLFDGATDISAKLNSLMKEALQ